MKDDLKPLIKETPSPAAKKSASNGVTVSGLWCSLTEYHRYNSEQEELPVGNCAYFSMKNIDDKGLPSLFAWLMVLFSPMIFYASFPNVFVIIENYLLYKKIISMHVFDEKQKNMFIDMFRLPTVKSIWWLK